MVILAATAKQPHVHPTNPVEVNFNRVLRTVHQDDRRVGVAQNQFEILRQILANPKNLGKIGPESLMSALSNTTLTQCANQSVVRLAVAHLHATTTQEFHLISKIPPEDVSQRPIGIAARDILLAITEEVLDPRRYCVDRYLAACEVLAQTGAPIGKDRLDKISKINTTLITQPDIKAATLIMVGKANQILAELSPKR